LCYILELSLVACCHLEEVEDELEAKFECIGCFPKDPFLKCLAGGDGVTWGAPICEEGNQEQGDWDDLGRASRGTSVSEGEHLDMLCVCVEDGAWIRVEPISGFMPLNSIELDELWGSRLCAVIVTGKEVSIVFMLKPEGRHKLFHPMQVAYRVGVCIDGEQGEGAGCSLICWIRSALLSLDSSENHAS